MIYIFRKEIKKWHSVLWIVFVSLALSGASFFFFRQKHISEIHVATVNGYPVYFEAYRRSLAEINGKLDSLRPLAQSYGMSEEVFFRMFFGGAKPEEMALDTCVNEVLLNTIKDEFKITIDSAWFGAALAKTIPQFIDETGKVNMDSYQRYLQRLATTPAEYERGKMEEFKREAVHHFIANTSYVSKFMARDVFESDHALKTFAIATFSLARFQDIVNKEPVDEKKLADYFQVHKELYRVSEKRKARYWTLGTEAYVQKTDIDQAMVKNYYDRHKGSLYRIPPKVKVRRIFIKHSPTARDVAHDVHQQLTKDSSKFAALAQKHSNDATAQTGGLVDFFVKGTHDKEFEQIAFRLKNTGDISSVTKTQAGYEVVQLVDRVKAGEKSFDTVKDEIVQGMQVRRAVSGIRSDLEAVMRTMAEDSGALDRFVKKHNTKEEVVGWLTEKDAQDGTINGVLAKRLFVANKRQNAVGFFNFKDHYIVYQCTGVEKSMIPPFESVKQAVLDQYRHESADALARNTLKQIRTNILDKKLSFDEAVASAFGKVVTTKSMSKNEGAKGLNWLDAGFREKIFSLTDAGQVLEYMQKDEYCLAVLKNMTYPDGVTFDTKYPQIIKQEKFKAQRAQGTAFIASLHRNAKIETDHKMLEGKSTDMREE